MGYILIALLSAVGSLISHVEEDNNNAIIGMPSHFEIIRRKNRADLLAKRQGYNHF